MQKSVLVPFEKYQRLLEGNTKVNKETREATTETDRPPLEEKKPERSENLTEKKTEATAEEEDTAETTTEISPAPLVQVSESLEKHEPLKKKRQRRSRPPGIRDYKSMWIKLNGKL